MLKKRELIKNADSRATAAKLKVQPKRQNKKISFAGGKNAPTRIMHGKRIATNGDLRFEPTLQDA